MVKSKQRRKMVGIAYGKSVKDVRRAYSGKYSGKKISKIVVLKRPTKDWLGKYRIYYKKRKE